MCKCGPVRLSSGYTCKASNNENLDDFPYTFKRLLKANLPRMDEPSRCSPMVRAKMDGSLSALVLPPPDDRHVLQMDGCMSTWNSSLSDTERAIPPTATTPHHNQRLPLIRINEIRFNFRYQPEIASPDIEGKPRRSLITNTSPLITNVISCPRGYCVCYDVMPHLPSSRQECARSVPRRGAGLVSELKVRLCTTLSPMLSPVYWSR